jgi:hypothetical protein
VGLLLGTSFFDFGDDPDAALGRFGFIFYVLAFMGFGGIPVVPVLFNLKVCSSDLVYKLLSYPILFCYSPYF